MGKAPCKNCTERHAGCHSQCEKYIAFARESEEIRQKRYSEQMATPLTNAGIRQLRKNMNKKRK